MYVQGVSKVLLLTSRYCSFNRKERKPYPGVYLFSFAIHLYVCDFQYKTNIFKNDLTIFDQHLAKHSSEWRLIKDFNLKYLLNFKIKNTVITTLKCYYISKYLCFNN